VGEGEGAKAALILLFRAVYRGAYRASSRIELTEFSKRDTRNIGFGFVKNGKKKKKKIERKRENTRANNTGNERGRISFAARF